eukprot:243999_1
MPVDLKTFIAWTNDEVLTWIHEHPRLYPLWRPIKRSGLSGRAFVDNLGLSFLQGVVRSPKTRSDLLELCFDELMDDVVKLRFAESTFPEQSSVHHVLTSLNLLPSSLEDCEILKLLVHRAKVHPLYRKPAFPLHGQDELFARYFDCIDNLHISRKPYAFVGSPGCGKTTTMHELIHRIQNPRKSTITGQFNSEFSRVRNYLRKFAIAVIDFKTMDVKTEIDLALLLLHRFL